MHHRQASDRGEIALDSGEQEDAAALDAIRAGRPLPLAGVEVALDLGVGEVVHRQARDVMRRGDLASRGDRDAGDQIVHRAAQAPQLVTRGGAIGRLAVEPPADGEHLVGADDDRVGMRARHRLGLEAGEALGDGGGLPVERLGDAGINRLEVEPRGTKERLARGRGRGEHEAHGRHYRRLDSATGLAKGAGAVRIARSASASGATGSIGWVMDVLLAAAGVLGAAGLLVVLLLSYLRQHTTPDWPTWRAGFDFDPDRLPLEEEREHRITELREADPGFDPQTLGGRAARIVVAVHEALASGRLDDARPLMSDAVWQRLKTQAAVERVSGVRTVVAEVEPFDVRLAAVATAGRFDEAHLGIQARRRVAQVPANATDAVALQRARTTRRTATADVWSFVRRRGARAGVVEGRCPNCGAPYAGGATGRCDHCQAVVNTGDYDWVLAEVSRAEEFTVTGVAVPGLEALQARDADCAVEILEDRASLLFWRYVEALALEDATRLRKVADPDVVAGVAARLAAARADGVRVWYAGVAVLGVDLVGLDLDESGTDEAHVRVRWVRGRAVGPRDRAVRPRASERCDVVVLARKVGAQTDRTHGILTYRCWRCHGPLGDSDSTCCDHCDAEQVDGEHHWTLAAVENYEQWLTRRWRRHRTRAAVGAHLRTPSAYPLQYPSERRRLLRLMAAIATADGRLAPEERRLLERQGEAFRISRAELREILAVPDAEVGEIRGTEAAAAFLRGIAESAAADGHIGEPERRLLERMALRLDVSPADLDRAIADALAEAARNRGAKPE